MKKILLIIFMLIIFSSFTYADNCQESYLNAHTVVYYKLEESGLNYIDATGNLNLTIGTIPTRDTGIINFGQNFSSASSEYLSTVATDIDENVPFTWMAWVNPNSIGAKMSIMDNRLITTNRQGCVFDVETTGKIRILCYENSGPAQGYMDTNELISPNQWTQLVAMYDGGYKIYINSTQATQSAGDVGIPGYDTDQPIIIGALDGSGTFFNGGLDEIAVFDIGLNQTCINYLYNSHSPSSLQQPPYIATNISELITTLVYPTNGTHYNLVNPLDPSKVFNGSLVTTTNKNATCTNVNYGMLPIFLPPQVWNNVTIPTKTQVYTNYSLIGEKNYSVIITCTDGSNTTTTNFWFIVDNTDVTTTINFINNTIQASEFNLSVSYYDNYLYRTNTTILRMSDNFTIYNNDSGVLGYETLWYNVTYPIDLLNSTYTIGDYIKVILNGVDTHTANKFKERPTKKKLTIFDKNIKEYNLKHGRFRLEYPKDYEITEDYSFDRMHFKIKNNKNNKESKFIKEVSYQYVEGDKIVYYPESEYPCHMIVNDHYWYDCVGMKNPIVTKEMDNRYRIDYIQDKEEIITKSLGGLNEIYEEYIFKINKNYLGNIIEGDFFNPPNAKFNYTANQNFTVSSLLLDEDCITITGSNVTGFDKKYCYSLNSLTLEDVVLFAGATDIDSYINISNSTGEIIQTNFNWFGKNSTILKSGFNLCDSNSLCTLDTLSGALISSNNYIGTTAILNQSWFNFMQNTSTINTSEVGLCNNISLIYPIANFSYFDELTNSPIIVSASYDLTFYEGSSTFNIQSNNSGEYTSFCTDVNPTASVFNLKLYDTIILSSSNYITRVFNIPFSQGLDVSNDPYYNYSYYLIQVANSSTITYTWKNTDYATLDGIMQIYRCEDDGTKTLIESTNVAGGKATANLQLFSTAYSYSMTIDDITYTEPQYYDCHVESTDTQNYYVDVSQIDVLPVVGLYLMDCHIYNVSSTIVKMEWDGNDEDATDIKACIVGYREDIYGRTKVYESCVNQSSGSLTRNVVYTGFNYYVQGTLTQNGNEGYCQETVVFNQRGTTSKTAGVTGAFLGALFIIALALLFAGDGILVILGSIVAILVIWFIGIITFNWIVISSIILLGVGFILIGRYTLKGV